MRVVQFVQHQDVQVVRFFTTPKCANGLVFTTPGCASGLVFTTPKGASASGPVCTTPECASANLVNVRVVWLLLYRDAQVLV